MAMNRIYSIRLRKDYSAGYLFLCHGKISKYAIRKACDVESGLVRPIQLAASSEHQATRKAQSLIEGAGMRNYVIRVDLFKEVEVN